MLAQGDFSCLELAAGQDADGHTLDDYDGITTIKCAGSGDSLSSEPVCEANNIYLPVNFIPEEVYELIRKLELARTKQPESIQAHDSMDTESSSDPRSSEDIFEPMRRMSVSNAPPKLFYRTFWRSVTRRLLQHEKEFARSRALISSSGLSTFKASH